MNTIDSRGMAEHMVSVLNEALEIDHDAMWRLFVGYRAKCNEEFANHSTIQCKKETSCYSVSCLGLLNGLLGIKQDGMGYIVAKVEVICPSGCDTSGQAAWTKCSHCGRMLDLGKLLGFTLTD